jgi:hypothetical protein
MSSSNPYTVSVPTGKIPLIIMDAKYGVSAAFALMGTKAKSKVALRIGGGCKGMNSQDKQQMIGFFLEALAGYEGVVWSGATRQIDKNGELDPMVTDVPGFIAAENPDCVALGTLPRTDVLRLQHDLRLVLDDYGTIPNPSQHGILIVQNGPDEKMDWNGDVDAYVRVMEMWRDHAGFSALGLISWNGGAVTQEEIEKASSRKWLTVLVKGSGRVTDEIIAKLENGGEGLAEHFKGDHVCVVSKDEPEALRDILVSRGLISVI